MKDYASRVGTYIIAPWRVIENYDPELQVVYCSFNQRMQALMIDLLMLALLMYPISILFEWLWPTPNYSDLFTELRASYPLHEDVPRDVVMDFLWHEKFFHHAVFNIFLTYCIMMFYYCYTAYRLQASVGKWLFGYKICNIYGQPAEVKQIFRRSLFYIVSALPCGLGFLWPLVSKKGQAFHDIMAGTVIVQGKHDFSWWQKTSNTLMNYKEKLSHKFAFLAKR